MISSAAAADDNKIAEQQTGMIARAKNTENRPDYLMTMYFEQS